MKHFTVKQLIQQLQRFENQNLPVEIVIENEKGVVGYAGLTRSLWDFEVPNTSSNGFVVRIHCERK